MNDDSILDAEVLETPRPAMPAAPHVFAPRPAPSASSPNWLAPLLLAGGGVAALGMVCVFGLVLLVGFAAALEGGSSSGSDYAGGTAYSSGSGDSAGGGSYEDRTARAVAELGGSYNMDSNAVGRITYKP